MTQEETPNSAEEIEKVQQKVNELSLITDVPLEMIVTLGGADMMLQELLLLQVGSVIELDKLAGEPLDISVKQRPVAKGEVVVINEKFGVRMTDIIGS
ncbi:MAG: flagellar motor switch protein FliN [Bacteriovoracaceae bacterium]|nr:flagellar motor switch protein FliN [Bacteriovoracaceae bacterium]